MYKINSFEFYRYEDIIKKEDDFTSLTSEQIEKFKEKYQSPEIFTLFNGELHVMKMPPQEQKEQKKSQKNDAQQKHPAKKKKRSGDAR